MQIELRDQIPGRVRNATNALIGQLVDERVKQKRPLLRSVSRGAFRLALFWSVDGVSRGGTLR